MVRRIISIILATCIVLSFSFAEAAYILPDSWNPDLNVVSRLSWNGHTYELYDKGVTWLEAKNACESLGGYLACITSEEEQETLELLLQDENRVYYWLGGTDEIEEGNWKWLSGERWHYTNWGGNE